MLPIFTNHTIGTPFIELISVDSTNNYAMAELRKGTAVHGAAFFACEQTHGKGQHEKIWLSEKGANLVLSLVLNTSALQLPQQFLLSMSIALATHELFSKYVRDDTFIKWPNDIYWRDRKAAGILIENIVTGNKWQWAVVGIGVNINQTKFDDQLTKAVSLKQICGKTFNPVTLAKELCLLIEIRYTQLLTGMDRLIISEYNKLLYKRQSFINLKKDNIVFPAFINQVDEFGFLHIGDPVFQKFSTGEVQWLV